MRKAEIMQHLKMHGIEVSGGKGEMKGQLRVLRDALLTGSRSSVMVGMAGVGAGGMPMGVVGGGMPVAPLQQQQQQQQPQQQQPPVQPGLHSHVGGAGLVEGYDDEYGAVVLSAGTGMRGCGEKCVECNRKGNKLCPHKRCRACCAAFTRLHGLACPIHYKGITTIAAPAGGMGIGGSVALGGMGLNGGAGLRGARGQMAYGVTVKSERPFPAGGSGGNGGSGGGGGRRSRGERGRRGHGGSGGGHSYPGKGGNGSGSGSGVNIAGCAAADSGLHSNGRRLAFQRGPRPSVFYKLCKHKSHHILILIITHSCIHCPIHSHHLFSHDLLIDWLFMCFFVSQCPRTTTSPACRACALCAART